MEGKKKKVTFDDIAKYTNFSKIKKKLQKKTKHQKKLKTKRPPATRTTFLHLPLPMLTAGN